MKIRNPEIPVFLSVSGLIWIYLFLRAIFVPMGHDEIATFHSYIQTGDFLWFVTNWDMNNHEINSALSALFYSLFGLSPLVLRLANLIMFPLFCYYLWKTGYLLPGRVARRALWITLLLSHGFLEFFSLSRGYGMSMAFLMPVLFYTLLITEKFTTRKMIAAVVWGIISAMANLTLLSTFLILIGWLALVICFSRQVSGFHRKMVNILCLIPTGIIPAFIFVLISFKARKLGLLYTGGSKGFFTDTVRTLLPKMTGLDNMILYSVAALLFLFIAGYGIYTIFREKSIFRPGLVFPVFLCANIISYLFLNRFLHVNYPEDRTAVYLFPLFAGSLCFAAGDLAFRTGRRWFLITLVPLLFFPVHFAYSINLTHSEFYIEDPIPVSFYDAVKASHRPGDYPPTVGGHRLRHFCWSFNDFRYGGTESQIYWGDYPGNIEDFQIADSKELSKYIRNYSILVHYPANNKYLLKRNTFLNRQLLTSVKVPDTQKEATDEYYPLFSGSLDTLHGKSIYIGFEGRIESPAVPFEAWIVADAGDSSGTMVCYEKLSLSWLRPEWGKRSASLKNGILIANLPGTVRKLKVYLWNIKQQHFNIRDFKTELYILK